MGIRGLLPFLRSNYPITQIKFDELISRNICRRYPIVCIDFNQFLFKYLHEYNAYNSFKYEKNQFIEQKFEKLICKFNYFNVDVIFVMDGLPHQEKKCMIDKRKTKTIKYHSKLQTKSYSNPFQEHDIRKPTLIEFNDCENMEKYFIRNKIKFIHNDNYEADLLCKWLVEYEIADYALSNDTDLLAYGCKHVLFDFDYINNTFMYINYDDMLDYIGLTSYQFLDLCISCGTDYNSRFTQTEITYKLLKLQINHKLVYTNLQHIIDDIDNILANVLTKIGAKIEILCKPTHFDYKKVLDIYNYYLSPEIIQTSLTKGRVYLNTS